MITAPAEVAQVRPAPARNWRIIAGLAALLGGGTMVAGAFLPWVETFAGLIDIPGMRGTYGRLLAAAGLVIAAAGLCHVIGGRRWPRWLAGVGGFAALGFSGYLLIQLAVTVRALGGDSMVLARGGPGLWVTGAGALIAFATLFLPMPQPAAPQPAAPQPAAAQSASAQSASAQSAGPALTRPAWVDLARQRVLTLTADLASSGPRRRLQVALGLVWLADAALQLQPAMFTRAFVSQMLTPAAAANPAGLAGPALWATRLISHNVPAWNTAFALAQFAIALGLLWRPAIKAALAGSIAWALGVWWIGEGLGGLTAGTADPLTGAPGAVILYALLAVLVWPPRTPATEPGSVATTGPAGKWAKAAWVILWASFAYLILQPAVRAPRGLALSVALAILFTVIAAGIMLPATTRPVLVIAIITAAAIWAIGESFGQLTNGMATDPNTGPLLILLAIAFWVPSMITKT